MELLVYDEREEKFRQLDKSNFNDDVVCGTIFLKREAISLLRQYYHICGFVLIGRDNDTRLPIDIQEDKISLLEGTYNCMPYLLQESLVQYNIQTYPEKVWSSFFFRWLFLGDYRVFDECGSFIQLCSHIINTSYRLDKFRKSDIALFEPTTYNELCCFVRDILNLSQIDFNSYDYYERFKYLVDSLYNGYHIRFSTNEIQLYCSQISQIIDKEWKE